VVITIPKSKGKTTAKDLYAGSNPTSIRRSMFASFGSHVTADPGEHGWSGQESGRCRPCQGSTCSGDPMRRPHRHVSAGTSSQRMSQLPPWSGPGRIDLGLTGVTQANAAAAIKAGRVFKPVIDDPSVPTLDTPGQQRHIVRGRAPIDNPPVDRHQPCAEHPPWPRP
jgi:hypothetical protein